MKSLFNGGIHLLKWHLRGGGEQLSNYEYMRTGGWGCPCERLHINVLIKYLFHKLLAIITILFVSLIKITKKTFFLKKLYFVCLVSL